MSVTVTTRGVENIQHMLKNLDKNIEKRVVTSALRNTAKPIVQAAEQNLWANQRTGRLYRSIGQKADRKRPGEPHRMRLGARTHGRFKGYQAHLIEDGTEERFYTTKTGKRKSVGRIRGTGFWSNALKSNEPNIQRNMFHNIVKAIEREVSRLNRKS